MQIGEYHEQRPEWRTGLRLSGEWVGLELEVMCLDGRRAAANALDSVDFGLFPPPIAERDGSLSSEYGVEIVCPPLPLEEVLRDDGYIARMMQQLQLANVDEGTNGYGMHINFNVADWGDTVAETVTYLLSCDRQATEAAGGRRLTSACNGTVSFYRQDVDEAPRLYASKYVPARLRTLDYTDAGEEVSPPDILEFRAPASTLVHGNLRRAIEYVFAIKNRVQQQPAKWYAACLLDSTLARLLHVQTHSTGIRLLSGSEPTFDVDEYLSRASNLPLPEHMPPLPFLANNGVSRHDNQAYFESALSFIHSVAEGGRPWETSQAASPVTTGSSPPTQERIPTGQLRGSDFLSVTEYFALLDAGATAITEFSGGSPVGEQQVGLLEGARFYTRHNGTIVLRQPRITTADLERIQQQNLSR